MNEKPLADIEAAGAPARDAAAEDLKLRESFAGLQKLTDPKARKAFYEAHPELQRILSPVNFHSA